MKRLLSYGAPFFATCTAGIFNLVGFTIYLDREYTDDFKVGVVVLVTGLTLLCGMAIADTWPDGKED